MEMQFYPPGWASFNIGASGTSCDATKWCAALNIDSLSDQPVTGLNNNNACAVAARLEYVNFAFITKNGVPQGPPSPLLANASTFVPDRNKVLFMNSGDTIITTMHDTHNGLRIDIQDLTNGRSGFMVASASNGFAQVKFDPQGTNCDPATHNLPYNFHPMYSTSSEKTSVPWAAHTYNIAFSDEIGHFDFCTSATAITPTGSCPAGNLKVRDQPKAQQMAMTISVSRPVPRYVYRYLAALTSMRVSTVNPTRRAGQTGIPSFIRPRFSSVAR